MNVDGVEVDSHLLTILDAVRPGVRVPIILTVDEASGARAREIESLGAHVTYIGRYVPQIHANILDGTLRQLVESRSIQSVWYDRPTFAHSPGYYSSAEAIRQRLVLRVRDAEETLDGAAATFFGAMGAHPLKAGSLVFGLDDVARFVRSTDLIDKYGATGRGVKVAILDTGADESHPMLAGAIRERASFVNEPATGDGSGHGSWCASAAAGRPVEYRGKIGSKRGVVLQGMAPEADLYIGKVLTSEAAGATSTVIRGIEQAVAWGVDIMSLSLGSILGEGGLDPSSMAVNAASDLGVRCCVAAGNDFVMGSVGSPGTAAGAITVGAVAMQRPYPGVTSRFSSKGPTSTGRIKPDVAAPGGQLLPGFGLVETILGAGAGHAAAITNDPPGFVLEAGTSMSTPCVAGVLAQLVPLGLPKRRDEIEGVLAFGARRGAPGSFESRLPKIKNPREGWGIIDGVKMMDAIQRNAPALPVRNVVRRLRESSFALRLAAGRASTRVAHSDAARHARHVPKFTLL